MNSEVLENMNRTVPFLEKGVQEYKVSDFEMSKLGISHRLEVVDVADEARLRLREGNVLDHVYVVGRDDVNLYWSNFALGVRACNLHETFEGGKFIDSFYSPARGNVRLLTSLKILETTPLNSICDYVTKK